MDVVFHYTAQERFIFCPAHFSFPIENIAERCRLVTTSQISQLQVMCPFGSQHFSSCSADFINVSAMFLYVTERCVLNHLPSALHDM